jgi:hypothetical protein
MHFLWENAYRNATPPLYIRFWPLPAQYLLMVDVQENHIPMSPCYLVLAD